MNKGKNQQVKCHGTCSSVYFFLEVFCTSIDKWNTICVSYYQAHANTLTLPQPIPKKNLNINLHESFENYKPSGVTVFTSLSNWYNLCQALSIKFLNCEYIKFVREI